MLEEEVPTELKVLLDLDSVPSDVLDKHTTEDPAPGCLSRRRIAKMIYFKLWVVYFHLKNPCATCYQSHSGNGISKTKNLLEISRNPSLISSFPSPKIRFSSPKFRFSLLETRFPKISFLLYFSAFRFLQRLSAFSWRLSDFSNGYPISSEFLERLSDFPHRLSAFREIRENLIMARSIRKFAIRAS